MASVPVVILDSEDSSTDSEAPMPKTSIRDYYQPNPRPPITMYERLMCGEGRSGSTSSRASGPSRETQHPVPTDEVSTDEVSLSQSGSQSDISSSQKKHNGRPGTYATYTLGRKIAVLRYFESHSESGTSKHFGIPRMTIRAWKKLDKDQASSKSKAIKGLHSHKGAGRPLSYNRALENQLLEWILENRDLQVPVQRKTIQLKAVALIQPSNPSFRASDGWLQKFMAKNALSLRRTASIQQKLPANLEKKLEEFMDGARALREHHKFSNDLVINMDETPIFFDMHNAYTVHRKGAREVRVAGTSGGKKRVTFVVTCTASGRMLKPFVIIKGKTARSMKKVNYDHSKVSVMPQAKAWMDETGMKCWIREVLVKYTKHQPCLLVMDSFAAHLTANIRQELTRFNASILVVPAGTTSKVQPVDVSLNKPIKQIVRGKFEEYLASAIADAPSASVPTPSTTDVISWITKANNCIGENVNSVAKSFKVCGISNALDGSENHLIRCATELPGFNIPYGNEEPEVDDIFNDDDDDDEDGDVDDDNDQIDSDDYEDA